MSESPNPAPTERSPCYTGEVIYLYAFDIAYEIGRLPIRELLGRPLTQYSVDASKRNPRHLFFFKPQMIRLGSEERQGPRGLVKLEKDIKILPVGAISIRIRVPFAVETIEDLVAYHDLRLGSSSLNDEVRKLADEVRKELLPYCIRPVDVIPDEEAYTVFCLRGPIIGETRNCQRAEAWLELHRREVAALLTQEHDLASLSRQEAIESTARHLSYYEDDLAVVDWDAALLVDDPSEWEETLYVLELANLQLAELEAYDRLLDATLDRSYRDLRANPIRTKGALLRDLRELRIDMARFSDELSNITKFIGDWYVARVYETVAGRFHLADWHRTVNEKLRTVGELHELIKHDQTNRWMMILEVTVVLLFLIDIAFLIAGFKH